MDRGLEITAQTYGNVYWNKTAATSLSLFCLITLTLFQMAEVSEPHCGLLCLCSWLSEAPSWRCLWAQTEVNFRALYLLMCKRQNRDLITGSGHRPPTSGNTLTYSHRWLHTASQLQQSGQGNLQPGLWVKKYDRSWENQSGGGKGMPDYVLQAIDTSAVLCIIVHWVSINQPEAHRESRLCFTASRLHWLLSLSKCDLLRMSLHWTNPSELCRLSWMPPAHPPQEVNT